LCKYQQKAIFVSIYITEAHSRDEWPVGNTISFCNQPTMQNERCGLAKKCVEEYQTTITMLVDTMSNEFENTFAAWPFRFFGVIRDTNDCSKLVLDFKPQPDLAPSYGYKVTSIEAWIESRI